MVEWMPFLMGFVPVVADVLLGLAGLGVSLLSTWLVKKSKSEVLDRLINRARGLADEVVGELKQTLVDDLKKASADGKLTKDEKDAILSTALDRLKAHLGQKAQMELQRYLGSAGALNNLLRTLIEHSVSIRK